MNSESNDGDRRSVSGLHGGRRRWDLPPNLTKLLLALIPILSAIAIKGYV